MRRFVVAVLALLACAVATGAQAQESDPTGKGFTTAELVELRRPDIHKRPLSGEEKAMAKALIAELKQRPTLFVADQLRLFANTGDRSSMKAVFDSFQTRMFPQAIDQPEIAGDVPGRNLRGLWAAALWREGERSKDLSRAIDDCEGGISDEQRRRCGFGVQTDNDPKNNFGNHWAGKGKPPKTAVFTDYSMASTPEADRARFEKIVETYRSGRDVEADDYHWAAGWAKRDGAESRARWDGSGRIAIDNSRIIEANRIADEKVFRDRQIAEQKAIRERQIAGWTAYETSRKAGKLSDADHAAWVGYSIALGGAYLEGYAMETYLADDGLIESFCNAKLGATCNRQRAIRDKLAADARLEQLDKELALRNITLGGGSTMVRSYDQNGNYLGAQSMPSWQADILAGK
jgi:hypothetical protein